MMLRKRLHDDANMSVSRYSAAPMEVFSIQADLPISSATVDKYLIYTAGEMTIKDSGGNVVLTRHAGDTTDTGGVVTMDAGIHYFECSDEQLDFYSVLKTDRSRVNRIEHRLKGNVEHIFKTPCLLFIAMGYVDVKGVGTIPAPYVLEVVSPTQLTAIDASLIVELT